MKTVLIIYHREDNDGACSGGMVQAFLERFPVIQGRKIARNECELYGVNYADLSKDWNEMKSNNPEGKKARMLKWDKFYDVFMVDISFNDPEAMNYMYDRWRNHFHWCDHHAPIIETSKSERFGECPGVRRTDQSAILNVWEYFKGLVNDRSQVLFPSTYIKALSDYDSWMWTKLPEYQDKAMQESLMSFNVGCTRSSNLKPDWYTNWVGSYLDGDIDAHNLVANKVHEIGRIIYKVDTERIARAIHTHGDVNWIIDNRNWTRKACAVISTDHFNSQSFEKFKGTDIVNGIVFKVDATNDKVIMSLYNVNDDDEFNCGEWLKNIYNGGGHRGAAGCTLTREQFIEMFKDRKI